jgi:hypothetical protein
MKHDRSFFVIDFFAMSSATEFSAEHFLVMGCWRRILASRPSYTKSLASA